jgi:hypothetical protein
VATTDLGLFEAGIVTGFKVSQIGEYAFLELFHVAYGPAESFKAKDEGANDVGAGYVIEPGPKNTRHVFAGREQKAIQCRMRCRGMGGAIECGRVGVREVRLG